MSVVDSVFVAVPDSSAQVAAWLVDAVGCELLGSEAAGKVRLRVRGTTVDDWLGLVVQPNGYILSDPEPDEVQAMDAYPIEVQIRAGGADKVLHQEAGLIFGKLLATRSDLPMLLVHNLDTLVGAHLPGTGTQTFDPPISPDAQDAEIWRPWVIG